MSDRLEEGTDWSTAHLLARVDLVRARVEAAVAARRKVDPKPDDPYRGVYTDDRVIDHLLSDAGRMSRRPPPDPGVEAASSALGEKVLALRRAGTRLRLDDLAEDFHLHQFDVDLLLVGLAPDLDPSFEKLYGYLNDDVTRRRASVGLALEVCGASVSDGWARSRLGNSSPLIAGGLASVEDSDRPLLGRSLRIPDRVVDHLLGRDEPDPMLAPLLIAAWGLAGPSKPRHSQSARWRRDPVLRPGTARIGWPLVSGRRVDWSWPGRRRHRLGPPLWSRRVKPARCDRGAEACLRRAALVVTHVEAASERGPAEVRRWAESPGLVALAGSHPWDPRWSRRPPLLVDVPTLADNDRLHTWTIALEGKADHLSLSRAVAAYRLTPEQVDRAAEGAVQRATAAVLLEAEDLQAGARGQNSAGLQKLAHRITARASWDDLVLPRNIAGQLRSIAGRVRQRGQVFDEWQLGSTSSRAPGVTALFAGDSGTGKTMSAEVVARSLGLDLYIIDLSTVVDKYIGETEKNLDRIFGEAERVNGVLLFDEADAIFGKRSEVKDARDRYANVEVAYLLQRMEQFGGLAILTTNLRANVDEAFLRRIDLLIEFPVPDAPSRGRLWAKQLTPQLPVAGDIDIEFLASAFEMSGGNIRNVVLAAAFEAAEEEVAVSMAHLIRATAGEYRKLGRLCVQTEFGPYYAQLAR